MNISADTIAIMLTMAFAMGGGAWAVRGVIGRLQVEVRILATEVKANRKEIQAVREETKFIRRQINSHRHHTTGEVYYERDIVNDETEATARQ